MPLTELGHAIPIDGFPHVRSLACPCGPFIEAIPGLGGAVCHRHVENQVADTFPEEWVDD